MTGIVCHTVEEKVGHLLLHCIVARIYGKFPISFRCTFTITDHIFRPLFELIRKEGKLR